MLISCEIRFVGGLFPLCNINRITKRKEKKRKEKKSKRGRMKERRGKSPHHVRVAVGAPLASHSLTVTSPRCDQMPPKPEGSFPLVASKNPSSKIYYIIVSLDLIWKLIRIILLWSSRKSTGSAKISSSAYISASKQLKGSNTTVRFPELVSIEHQGATASKVFTSGSTSSKCFFPNLRMTSH